MKTTLNSDKILNLEPLLNRLKGHRSSGDQIVFTNGCFDILHAGHVRYLSAAKSEGDVLVVGLNSDNSLRTIKGEKRPVIPQDQRAYVLAGLTCVDYVSLFDEPDPFRLIQAIRPHVLIKGEDWAESDIIGADIVTQHGGRVVRASVVPNLSTSQIIEKIINTYG